VGTGGGDVAGGADFAPTAAQLDSLKTLEEEMASVDAQFREILQGDLPSFNQALTQANLAPLLAELEKAPHLPAPRTQ